MALVKTPAKAKADSAAGQAKQQRIISLLNQAQQLLNDGKGDVGPNGVAASKAPRKPPIELAVQIRAWEDDPFLEAVAGADPIPAEPIVFEVPLNNHELLQTTIRGDQPNPDLYDPSSRDFLFWNAASALARGVNFWAGVLPDETQWSTVDEPMTVELDAGVDLNAFYSRQSGLNFFHDEVEGNTVFSGESPDVVCHELGHAILDAVKPELFDATSLEVAAFHEAFGDISGMLSALQLESMRTFVLNQTDGDLRLNSRISQMARELGWAIRQIDPSAVDRDSLRNAANNFFYREPSALPPLAPANQLSSEPHSFSRVFSGAFLDVLAGMFEIGGTASDDADQLEVVCVDGGRLIIEGIRMAPVGSGYYRQVAAGMVQADQTLFGGKYRAALISAFVRRGILATESAVSLARDMRTHGGLGFGVAVSAPRARQVQFDGDNEGYKRGGADAPALPLRALTTRFGTTFSVHLAAESNRFGVMAAAVTGGAATGISPEEDARSFVEDLIQQDRIADDDGTGVLPAELQSPGEDYPSTKTHRLAKVEGKVVLKRRHFDCGYRGCRQAH